MVVQPFWTKKSFGPEELFEGISQTVWRWQGGGAWLFMPGISTPSPPPPVDAAAAPLAWRRWAGRAAGGLCWWASLSQLPYPCNCSCNCSLLVGRASHIQFAFAACHFRGLARGKALKCTAAVVWPPTFKSGSCVIFFWVDHVATRSCPLFLSDRKKLHCFHLKKKKKQEKKSWHASDHLHTAGCGLFWMSLLVGQKSFAFQEPPPFPTVY